MRRAVSRRLSTSAADNELWSEGGARLTHHAMAGDSIQRPTKGAAINQEPYSEYATAKAPHAANATAPAIRR